jgi:staphylococcal nuclease domain-containing protein 1
MAQLWKSYDESQDHGDTVKEAPVVEEKENVERKVNYQKVVLTEVTDELQIYVQAVDKGTELEGLMSQIRQEFTANPPLPGSFTPKRSKSFTLVEPLDFGPGK